MYTGRLWINLAIIKVGSLSQETKVNQNCPFCDRAQLEEYLIGENETFWVIASLGQITDGGYLLLIPKRHVACIAELDKPEIKRLMLDGEKICLIFSAEYGHLRPFVFEHGLVGQSVKHAHLHFLPSACDITQKIRGDFPEKEIVRLNSWLELKRIYEIRREPYLLWIDTLSIINVCWDPPAQAQYLRTVVAEILGCPERANWREMDPELDRRLWSETVRRLKPYFE